MNWESKLRSMPEPSSLVVIINLLVILVIFFLLSSNFIFLPGIKTNASLPELSGAEIIRANKLIVTISFAEEDKPGKYIYTFNGASAETLDKLKGAINETLKAKTTDNNNIGDSRSTVILLHADKGIPMQEMVSFYEKMRDLDASIALVTDLEKQESTTRIQQVKEH